MAPPSQRYRQIGFFLEGGSGADTRFDLTIRPEDLTVAEPSRLVVQQTLGGAWADSFDRGIATINMSGTLGWRGGAFLSGEDAFATLRKTVFLDWHQRRADLIAQGSDPAAVRLTFIDTLDNLNFVVAPQQFTLRRSKSSPLLMRYQIRLLALDDADSPSGILDQITSALSNPLRWLAGVTGMGGTLVTMQSYLDQGLNLYGALSASVRNFTSMGSSVLGAALDVASSAAGVFAGNDAVLLGTARAVSQAGANALQALALDTLPEYELIPAYRLPALFQEADCTMANSFSLGRTYRSWDDLFGASGCSSTGGGDPPSPLAALNPFETYFPTEAASVQISPAATAALKTLQGADPLALLGHDATIAAQLDVISAGVSLP